VAEALEYGMIGITEGIISLELAPLGANESGQAAKAPIMESMRSWS
jgi:hypothetical protein